MDLASLRKAVASICEVMDANRDYLIELDQQNGDGDLGISMCSGFHAVDAFLRETEETDLGKLMMKCGGTFNERLQTLWTTRYTRPMCRSSNAS